MHQSDRTVSVRGRNIAYRDNGGLGFPIVFLHGSGASMDSFGRQFDSEILQGSRLIGLDLPGHGGSDDAANPDAAYSLCGFATTVQAFLETLGIQRAVLAGWSLGAHIAMEMLATSDVAAGLMITGAPPIPLGPLGMLRGFQAHWDLLLTSKEHFSERDERRFLTLCFGADKDEPLLARSLHRADGRFRPRFVRSILRGEGADEARAVAESMTPIAVVNGAGEPFARLSYLASLSYGNLWRDTCQVIEDAGHTPFWQQPAVYNALLHDFANDVAAREAAAPGLRMRA